MATTSATEILVKLAERTAAGKVNWQTTSAENHFLVHLGTYSVTVRDMQDPNDDEWAVVLTLHNNKGEQVDQFFFWQSNGTAYRTANELLQNARRKALKIDEALEAIMTELGKED